MDDMITRFRKSNRACFCAAALVLSNAVSVFTTASGISRLLESFATGVLLSIMLQSFKLLCEWRVAQGVGRRFALHRSALKAWAVFAVVLLGYVVAIGFSIFFSEVEFVNYGYSAQRWDAIAQSAVEKGYAEQLQALSDETASQKSALQDSIAELLDSIQSNIGAEQETLLEEQQAETMLSKYTPVLSDEGETLFDPEADRWVAQLRSAAQTLVSGETVSGLDDAITELAEEIDQTNENIETVMTKVRSTRTSRGNKNIQGAADVYTQQLLRELNQETAKLNQYQRIKADLQTLSDRQKRVQDSAAARLATEKMACRKALLTAPETLAESTRAFVEAAAELDESQTRNYSQLRAKADTYAVMEELSNYCSREQTADHAQDWGEAVSQLRQQAARLPAGSARRGQILRALDRLSATYLNGSPDPLARTFALLFTVPAEHRSTVYSCLVVAVLLDALSLLANLLWPKKTA